MKRKLIGLIVLALIVGVAAAYPAYVGHRIEQSMRAAEATARAAGGGALVPAVEAFRQGWLGSTATTRLEGPDGKPLMRLHHRIEHIVYPDLALARVVSVPEFDLEPKAKAELEALLAREPAFTVTSLVDWDGTVSSEILSPAFAKPAPGQPDSQLDWGGVRGTAVLLPDQTIAVDLNLPKAAVKSALGSAEIAGVRIKAKWNLAGAAAKDWSASFELAVGGVHVSSPMLGYAMSGLEMAARQIDKGNAVAVAFTVRAASGTPGDVASKDWSFSDFVIDLQLDGLTKAPLAKYAAESARLGGKSGSDPAQAMLPLGLELGHSLLGGSPSIALKTAGVTTPQGRVAVSFAVKFDGAGLKGPEPAAALARRVQAKAKAQVPAAMVAAAMQGPMRAAAEAQLTAKGQAVIDENIRRAVAEIAQQQVEQLAQAGMIVRQGADLLFEGELAGGRVTVNGKVDPTLTQMLSGAL